MQNTILVLLETSWGDRNGQSIGGHAIFSSHDSEITFVVPRAMLPYVRDVKFGEQHGLLLISCFAVMALHFCDHNEQNGRGLREFESLRKNWNEFKNSNGNLVPIVCVDLNTSLRPNTNRTGSLVRTAPPSHTHTRCKH